MVLAITLNPSHTSSPLLAFRVYKVSSRRHLNEEKKTTDLAEDGEELAEIQIAVLILIHL